MNQDSALKERLLVWLDSLRLGPGDKLPTLRQMERKFRATHYAVHRIMHEIALERDYLSIHGSGFYVPGKARAWKPFEKTIAYITPGMLLSNDLLAGLHRESIRRGFNFLNLAISHRDPSFEQETLEFLCSRRVWGVMIEPYPDPEKINLSILKKMRKNGIRCVLLSLPEKEKQDMPSSLLNFRKAGYMSASEAQQSRCSRVRFLNFSPNTWHTANFLEGLEEGCLAFGLELENRPVQTTRSPWSDEEEWDIWGELRPDASCAHVCETWNGRAFHLFRMLREQAISPSETIVIGYQHTPSEPPPFPVVCFDNGTRLLNTLKKIMTTRCVQLRDVYEPFLLHGSEKEAAEMSNRF